MADKIRNAYESSKNIYDGVLTQGNFFSRMYIRLFWSGTDDNDIARKVLSYIPDDFSGNLLDVPVGTAVFTEHKWKSLKNADITCLDYSMDMLEQAKRRFNEHGHIRCVQGDVGNLQMDDEAFDIVLSMNGFHAFPDKKKAFQEIWKEISSQTEQGIDRTLVFVVHGGTIMAVMEAFSEEKKSYYDWQVGNGEGVLGKMDASDGQIRNARIIKAK